MPQLQEALAPKNASAQVVQLHGKLQFSLSKLMLITKLFAAGLVVPVLHLH